MDPPPRPSAPASLLLDVPFEQLSAATVKLCRAALPGWADAADVSVARFGEGLSNTILKVTPSASAGGLRPVVVRVFGGHQDAASEAATVQRLGQHGFGAAVLCTFENGRVEALLPGRPLAAEEFKLAAVMEALAPAVARFHACVEAPAPAPRLWEAMAAMAASVAALRLPPARQALLDTLRPAELAAEVERARAAAMATAPAEVFAHNDVQPGNVLLDDATGGLVLIDFEYSAAGYRGFDLANHFNEWCGFRPCDWALYPTAEHQVAFVKAYLGAGDASAADDHAAVQKVLDEVEAFRPVSHLYWALWGVAKEGDGAVDDDFDYLEYARSRLGQYAVLTQQRC